MARRSLERSEEKVGVEEKEDERGRVSMGDMVCVWFDLNVERSILLTTSFSDF